MKVLKYSRQREAIKNCLMNRCDHPTADELYADIRADFPNISLGTVYRNLNLLVDIGEARKLTCGDGVDHFDAETHQHYHFICTECGKVSDMPLEYMPDLDARAGKNFSGYIKKHNTLFYGTCEDCAKKMAQ